MKHTIANDELALSVLERGAEVCALSPKDGAERIWQGDARYWPWHAPVCFPIVGRFPEDRCKIGGQDCRLTVHGFARERPFRLAEKTDDMLRFLLTDDEETRRMYPYKFEFEIGYRMIGEAVEVSYRVHNRDARPLPFAIGAHTAFRCPLADGEEFGDYELAFEQPEPLTRRLTRGGFLTGETAAVAHEGGRVPLSQALLADDVLVFSGLTSRAVELRHRETRRGVRVEYAGFPHLGIWTKPEGAPFVCIEPWQGCLGREAEPRLEAREGTLQLGPGQEYRGAYRITVI